MMEMLKSSLVLLSVVAILSCCPRRLRRRAANANFPACQHTRAYKHAGACQHACAYEYTDARPYCHSHTGSDAHAFTRSHANSGAHADTHAHGFSRHRQSGAGSAVQCRRRRTLGRRLRKLVEGQAPG